MCVSHGRDNNKMIARKMWVQMVRTPGESWWNTHVDNFPITIKEDERGYECCCYCCWYNALASPTTCGCEQIKKCVRVDGLSAEQVSGAAE